MKLTKRAFLGGVAASALMLSAGLAVSAQELREASTQLGWLRNGEFAALLVAEANGYFKEAGLKHTILDGGPGKNTVPIVGAGQATFGIASSARFVAAARAAQEPIDVVAIGTLFQVNPYAYITISDPGAPEPGPQDLVGKRVGTQPDGDFPLRAFLRANHIEESSVEISIVQGGAEPLLAGQIDYMSGFIMNQPYAIELEAAKPDAPANLKGKTWSAIPYSKYGAPNYGGIIFTKAKTVQDDPELVRLYLQAVARGVEFVVQYPDETAKIVAGFEGQVEDLPKLQWRGKIQTPLYGGPDADAHGYLWMNPETWQKIIDFFTENGELLNPVAVTEVMTNDFISGTGKK